MKCPALLWGRPAAHLGHTTDANVLLTSRQGIQESPQPFPCQDFSVWAHSWKKELLDCTDIWVCYVSAGFQDSEERHRAFSFQTQWSFPSPFFSEMTHFIMTADSFLFFEVLFTVHDLFCLQELETKCGESEEPSDSVGNYIIVPGFLAKGYGRLH